MDGYEKILKLMREQGQKLNPEGLRLARMASEGECSLGSATMDGAATEAEFIRQALTKSSMYCFFPASVLRMPQEPSRLPPFRQLPPGTPQQGSTQACPSPACPQSSPVLCRK